MLGFGVAAVGVYALASAVGSSVRAHLDLPWTLLMLLVLAGCATADLAFPHLRCSLVRRQTPQSLLSVVPAPIGGFLWGLDIGSVVSTYRASAATWAGLLLVLAGWGPWWSGAIYAAGFGVPLGFLVASHPAGSRDGPGPRNPFSKLAGADTDRSVVPALMLAAPRVRALSALLAVTAMAVLISSGVAR